MATNPAPPRHGAPRHGAPAEAVLRAGARLLAALDAGDADAALAAARERGGAVDRLVAGPRPDAALAARLADQDRALAERLGRARDGVAASLRQSGRAQHAAGRYAGAAPPRARLRARG